MPQQKADSLATLGLELGMELKGAQSLALAEYLSALVKWNRRINLVGTGDTRRIMSELVADSWHLASFLESLSMPANPRCIDVGAGAGLPGVPLRIFWTKGSWLMVEPREKRAAFLAYVLSRLELPRTSVVRARSEDLQEPHLPADFVTGRAAMPWPKFLELAAALLADGGRCIVFASEQRPGREPPEGFTLEEVREYRTAAGRRYFWSFAFSPRAASR